MAKKKKTRRKAKAKKAKTFVRAVEKVQHNKATKATALRDGSDTAIRLLKDIKNKRLDPVDLTVAQRRACLLLLANGTQTSPELAALFKVKPSTIRMDMKKIREDIGREVQEYSLAEVLGEVAQAKDKCSAAAMKQGDPGLSWTIARDWAKLLKELGVIEPERTSTDSLTLTIEAVGEGYERARKVLSRALDPRLTGEIIEVEPREAQSTSLKKVCDAANSQADQDGLEDPEEAE